MKNLLIKILILGPFLVISLALFGAEIVQAQSTNIVVTTITPPTPPPQVIHRVVVPASISVTLAPQLLSALDPQAPSGKVVRQMTIIGNADGSFSATIIYVNAPSPTPTPRPITTPSPTSTPSPTPTP